MIKQLYPQIKNKRTNEFLITSLMLNTNAYQWKWILTCYIIYMYICICKCAWSVPKTIWSLIPLPSGMGVASHFYPLST